MNLKSIAFLTAIPLFLAGCDFEFDYKDSSTASIPTVTSAELLDPTIAAGNKFGSLTVILANSNIVVTSPLDSSVASNNGAVHLYNPFTKTVVASFYGDTGNDKLGDSSITALGNNNFVIASPGDDVNSVVDAGSVMLINGATGAQIGSTIAGDNTSDYFGSKSITALGNNNFVIASPADDVNSVSNAGSVMLMNGATGAQIGSTIAGDNTSDYLGTSGITALGNNNFVIATRLDDVNSVSNAGSVMLMNGATGAQIGTTLAGDTASDQLGYNGITALGNNNFVIASYLDNVGGVVDAGSVMLINGATGAQIGSTFAGNAANDYLGRSSITALTNNNFVIASAYDDAGHTNNGSVMLVSGTSGAQIGSTLAGNTGGDSLGFSAITALTNNNFVIASELVDVGIAVDTGSVMLVSGATGAQIGSTLVGNATNDLLGASGITALTNNNFVIASPFDDVGVSDAGSVMLVNGATGALIGTIVGDTASDQLGYSFITALTNNNFVIASENDNVGGITDAGSVMLINGATGAQIGSTLAGDTASDKLGFTGVVKLNNNHFVVASRYDNLDSVTDAGSIRQIDTTGSQVKLIAGTTTDDMITVGISTTSAANFYVVRLLNFDKSSYANSGFATVVAY
jgi:predicted alpha/beta hydrolase family esterase